jgi:hypothetical protein
VLEPSAGTAIDFYRGARLAQEEPNSLLRGRPEPEPHTALRQHGRSERHIVRETVLHHEPEFG